MSTGPLPFLQVSMGIKIDNIPDIKAYLNNSASQSLPHKHIIASRITAEHAEEVGKTSDFYEMNSAGQAFVSAASAK